jgi:DNA-binding NarL/FixJ family response regulator
MTFYFVIGTTLAIYSEWISKVDLKKLFYKGSTVLIFLISFACTFAFDSSKYSFLISMNIFLLIGLFELGINEFIGIEKVKSVIKTITKEERLDIPINTAISSDKNTQLKIKLSEEQLSVLRLLIRGNDIVAIAKNINRSTSTIDGRINDLREIFEMNTIIGIIVKSASYGYLYEELESFRDTGVSISKDQYLTDHEKYILHGILKGHKNKQIADISNFSMSKVDRIRGKINDKWNVVTKADLVFKAIEKNYLQLQLDTPVLNGQDQAEVMSMFYKNSNNNLQGSRVYKMIYSSPNSLLIRLTPKQHETLQLNLKGFGNEGIAKKLKVTIETVIRNLKSARDRMSVDKIGELVLKSIDTGIVIVDNVQSFRLSSFKTREEHFFLELSKLLIGSDPTKVPGIKEDDAKEILTHYRSLWNVESIEGLLVEALIRGELIDSQIRAIDE